MTDPRFDVTTVGEALLRLSVPAGRRLQTAAQLDVHPGGAEANVTSALARLGRRCAWVGGLPATAIGRRVADHLRQAGVDLEKVAWSQSGRLGTYYVEFAEPPRPTQVMYDRADSCAARLTVCDLDWPYLLNTRLLHLTGITPALSAGCRALTGELIRRANGAGVPVSFDVNYRQKLWPPAEAAPALEPLIQGVELLICSRRDAAQLFGLDGQPGAVVRGLAERTGAHHVVLTLAEGGAAAWDGRRGFIEPALPVTIVDRIGAGDALAAGVIHGWLDGDLAKGLKYGVALAALALSQYGDAVMATRDEVEALVASPNSPLLR